MPETLRHLISRGPVDPSTVVGILGQLLETLAFDHWRGIIHGDIAPENIILGPGSRPSSMDGPQLFARNTAVELDDDFDLAPSGSNGALGGVSGSVASYTSPEQIGGSPADERSDVFSVAVVAYEMFTGRHPFGASEKLTAGTVAQHIVYEPPLEIPETTLAGLPQRVLAVLDVALAKDPNKRFVDARSFLDAVEEAAAVAPMVSGQSPPATSPFGRAPRRRRRSRRLWMIGAGVLLVAIVAAAVWLFLVRGGEPTAGVETTASTSPTTASVVVTDPTTTTPTTTTTMTPSTEATETTTTTLGTPARFEQSDSRIAYTGDWTVVTSSSASGGDFSFSSAAGASITITFDGTYLAWIAKKSPVYGKAQVTLDGKSLGTVDLYAETAGWQLKVWGTGNLKPGVHTLVIERTGTKNPAATGTIVGVDAFDVVGSLVKATQ